MNSLAQKQSFGQILFSPIGRLPRKPFWLYCVLLPWVTLIASAVLIALLARDASGAINKDAVGQFVMLGLAIIPFLWISLVSTIKRLRDRDMSGWWVLLNLIPYVGALALFVICVLPGTPGDNSYGPDARDLY